MQVSIDDAIKCLGLFRDKVPENGFISSCLDLSISALKTVQDGDYKIPLYREELEKLANFNCTDKMISCDDCPCRCADEYRRCMSLTADILLNKESEVIEWIQENYSKISQKL